MKQALLSVAAGSGAFMPFRVAHRREALIITYHRFAPAEGVPDTIAAPVLYAQLEYLTRHYQVVPLAWLADRLAAGTPPPGALAAITIDDGYDDVHDVALPVFRRFGVPATVFAVTGFLDDECWIWTDKTRHVLARTAEPRLDLTIAGRQMACTLETAGARRRAAARINRLLKAIPDDAKEAALATLAERLAVPLPGQAPPGMRPLTWQQARALLAAGIDIGSHTVSHPMLTLIDPRRLTRELADSRARLREELAAPVDLFCYPNGGVNPAVRGAVIQAGYRAAVTTVPGFNDAQTDAFGLRRIHTESDLPHFIQSTSGFEQFKARLRASPFFLRPPCVASPDSPTRPT